MKNRSFIVLIASLVVLSMAAPVMAAPSDDLSYDGDTHAPNPSIDVDTLTVAKHPISQGTSHDAMAGYEDDDGDWVDDPEFVVNTTSDVEDGTNVNHYTFNPAHIEADFFAEFPRHGDEEDNSASAIDADEWDTNSESGGTVSVSDTTVASNVDAVRINTGSDVTSTDSVKVGYANWSSQLDSDESKRVIQVAGDIDTLDSGARVEMDVEDESGDTKTLLIEPDASGQDTNASVMATGTGSFVYQLKLSLLSTSGGGSWDNIESVNVTVKDGDADLSLAWIDLAKKGKTVLAQKMVEDSDGDYQDTNTTYNATGTISTHDIGTLGSDFDAATLTDVQFPAEFSAAEMQGSEGEEDAYVVNWEDADAYPGYDHTMNVSYRLDTPAAIDLSYSGMDVDFPQQFPDDRYVTAGYETGVADDANLSQASLTDQTGSLGAPGDLVNFVSAASSDTNYVVTLEVLVTDDERNAITDTSAGGAGQFQEDSGGLFDTIMSWPGMILGGLLSFLGLRRFRG